MLLVLNKIPKLIKKNAEIAFLALLILLGTISTTFYNNKKIAINQSYKEVINNIYFQKSLKQIFDSLKPKYKSIDHKISSGETFDKILNSYSISGNEILEIKKNINSNHNLNNLKTNLNIIFTIDSSNNKKITYFLFPISRTEKIELIRNLDTDLFKKKKNYNKFKKKSCLQRRKDYTEFV